MPDYTFDKTITKTFALDAYLLANFPIQCSISVSGNILIITTVDPLSQTDLDTLTALIGAYTDPVVFLQLAKTESMSGVSEESHSTTFSDVQSIIFPSNTNTQDGTILNSLKSVLKISGSEADFSELGTGSVTVCLYDFTRQIHLETIVININETIAAWQAFDLGNSTNPKDPAYKSFMFEGLHEKSTDYDCIWTFKVLVSVPRIHARLNGMQKLFYTPL